MTSASELFYNRRSRAGRNIDLDLGLDHPLPSDRDPDLLRQPRRHRRSSRRRLHPRDECDPSVLPHAGPSQVRHVYQRSSMTEHELVGLVNSGPHSLGASSSSSNGGTTSSRLSRLTLTRNDRLPGPVLQARARLIERLGGILPATRRLNPPSSGIPWDEYAVRDALWVIDSGEWPESETESPTEWVDLEAIGSNKKPPGLSWEAIRCMPREFFRDGEEEKCDGFMRASVECCICLEGFQEGMRLVRLPCEHRFHPACLEPWVRICGDCPYCRASI